MKEEELGEIYESKFGVKDYSGKIKFEEFKKLFNKGCHYCGITNQQSQKLFNLRHNATRGGLRGMRLEAGRKDTFLPIKSPGNFIWCCYWCNNAKTNFFSEKEFIPIGKAIGEALKEILKGRE